MVFSVAVCITSFLAAPSAKIEVTEKRGCLGGDGGVEIHHGPIGPRVSADHTVWIVTRCAANAGVIAVRAFVTNRG